MLSIPDEGDPPDIDEDATTEPGFSLKDSLFEYLDGWNDPKAKLTSGWDRYGQLCGIKGEYDKDLEEIEEAIDKAPLPCYTVGSDD